MQAIRSTVKTKKNIEMLVEFSHVDTDKSHGSVMFVSPLLGADLLFEFFDTTINIDNVRVFFSVQLK